MKSFKSFMEAIELPDETLDIPRREMPQVAGKDLKHFLAYLKLNDVASIKREVKPSTLKASQGHFNRGKIQAIVDSGGSTTPILVSADNYVVDGHHRWIANMNLGKDQPIYQVNVDFDELKTLMHEYPRSFKEKLYECFGELICEADETCDIVTPAMMKQFETFVDRMFAKFNIDFDFTKHFRERMGDSRNKPCIKLAELADTIKKIYRSQGKSLKDNADAEVVIKDLQKDLNIPVAVEYNRRSDEFRVAMKTIMRKRNFSTPNKIVKV